MGCLGKGKPKKSGKSKKLKPSRARRSDSGAKPPKRWFRRRELSEGGNSRAEQEPTGPRVTNADLGGMDLLIGSSSDSGSKSGTIIEMPLDAGEGDGGGDGRSLWRTALDAVAGLFRRGGGAPQVPAPPADPAPRPVFEPGDLVNPQSDAHAAMTTKHPLNNQSTPTTCYNAAVFSLTLTGDLPPQAADAWMMTVPKANTYTIVDPTQDEVVTNPKDLSPGSIVCFYRRFRPDEKSALQAETDGGWVPFHMVVTLGGDQVIGANNGEREGTTPTWARNDITKMFDWTGKEDTQSMWTEGGLPPPKSFTVGGKEKYVAFVVPIFTAVARLKAAFPDKFD